MDQQENKSSEPQINGVKERGENGMREGVMPQMRVKEQIEKGEKEHHRGRDGEMYNRKRDQS